MFKLIWRRRSRSRGSQPRRPDEEVIELIRTTGCDNALWGAGRIRGEHRKLGIRASKRVMRQVAWGHPLGSAGTWSPCLCLVDSTTTTGGLHEASDEWGSQHAQGSLRAESSHDHPLSEAKVGVERELAKDRSCLLVLLICRSCLLLSDEPNSSSRHPPAAPRRHRPPPLALPHGGEMAG